MGRGHCPWRAEALPTRGDPATAACGLQKTMVVTKSRDPSTQTTFERIETWGRGPVTSPQKCSHVPITRAASVHRHPRNPRDERAHHGVDCAERAALSLRTGRVGRERDPPRQPSVCGVQAPAGKVSTRRTASSVPGTCRRLFTAGKTQLPPAGVEGCLLNPNVPSFQNGKGQVGTS